MLIATTSLVATMDTAPITPTRKMSANSGRRKRVHHRQRGEHQRVGIGLPPPNAPADIISITTAKPSAMGRSSQFSWRALRDVRDVRDLTLAAQANHQRPPKAARTSSR